MMGRALLFLTLVSSPLHAAEENDGKTHKQLYQAIAKPTVIDSVWTVTDTLTLRYPDLVMKFTKGTLSPFIDCHRNVIGFVFEGRAHVEFAPSPLLEKQQFYRFTKDSTLVCTTSRVLMRFTSADSVNFQRQDRFHS